jgi:hypothetical protein
MRQPFGGTGADLVYNPGTAAGDPITSVAGLPFHVYDEPTGTHLADITLPDGTPIAGSIITVDTTSQLPAFLGPVDSGAPTHADVYTLWVRAVAGGVIFRIFRNGGIPGPKGDAGSGPTDSQIAAAVATYLAANPPEPGLPGPPGEAVYA